MTQTQNGKKLVVAPKACRLIGIHPKGMSPYRQSSQRNHLNGSHPKGCLLTDKLTFLCSLQVLAIQSIYEDSEENRIVVFSEPDGSGRGLFHIQVTHWTCIILYIYPFFIYTSLYYRSFSCLLGYGQRKRVKPVCF